MRASFKLRITTCTVAGEGPCAFQSSQASAERRSRLAVNTPSKAITSDFPGQREMGILELHISRVGLSLKKCCADLRRVFICGSRVGLQPG